MGGGVKGEGEEGRVFTEYLDEIGWVDLGYI